MCIDKDLPPSERAELIALVSRQQDQVARLTSTTILISLDGTEYVRFDTLIVLHLRTLTR